MRARINLLEWTMAQRTSNGMGEAEQINDLLMLKKVPFNVILLKRLNLKENELLHFSVYHADWITYDNE